MKLSRKNKSSLWLSFVFPSLTLVLSLTGCANVSPELKSEPKATPLESQFDISSWRREVQSYYNEQKELLNIVEKRYSDK